MGLRYLITASAMALASLSVVPPALAGDLTLARHDATPLVESDIGKPYWTLEAQCAGMFGAGYAYETDHNRAAEAADMKQSGVDMLENALARLEADRGVDRGAAMTLVANEVEAGRAEAKAELFKYGDGAGTGWNMLRSACLDIGDAAKRHPGSSQN